MGESRLVCVCGGDIVEFYSRMGFYFNRAKAGKYAINLE